MGGRSKRGKCRGPPSTRNLVSDVLKDCDDPVFIDFLRRCLDLDPQSRMTPAEALRHPWMSCRRSDRQEDDVVERMPRRHHHQTTTTSTTTTTTATSAGDRHRRANNNCSTMVNVRPKLPPVIGTSWISHRLTSLHVTTPHYPSQRQSQGMVFTAVCLCVHCLLFRAIPQKSMQLRSPNLT